MKNDTIKYDKDNKPVEKQNDTYIRTPYVDIIEKGEQIEVLCDMPGVDKEKIDIEFEDNILTISGYQAEPVLKEGFQKLYSDFTTGLFKRTFNIHTDIDVENITASFKNGVLNVLLPKHEKLKAKKIPVAIG